MRAKVRWVVAAAAVAALHGTTAGDALAQAPASGFSFRHEAPIQAPRADVFRALVEQVGSWWDSEHTYTGDASNMSIEARPGGCFCEMFPGGGGVEHMRVVYVMPNQVLRLFGGLGPLQEHGVAGSMTWTLTDSGDATHVDLVYSIGGYTDVGFEAFAPPVTAVIGHQLRRLKAYVETGEPGGP